MKTQAPILPGAAIGVLGGGQLGRMFAIAARRMGYRVHTFSPDSDTPAGQVSDYEVKADYADTDEVCRFAQGVGVVTFEFENVPAETVEAASRHAPVRPSGAVLHTTQHRLREKTFLSRQGFPLAPFRHVAALADLQAALADVGCPAVLKTAGFGYDGKGQTKILSPVEAPAAFAALRGQEAVLEAFIDFEREVSVVAARTSGGDFRHYGVVENSHARHILDLSIAPAPNLSPALAQEAIDITRSVLDALEVVGVMCVEFFMTRAGRLLINELAPRPHNSGHFSFDACVTSQFEQQLRAVCGLPLGSTELVRPAAMANLLGDLWQAGREPDWQAALRFPEVKLHLYGKTEPRKGRKMGHLTALASTPAEAARAALDARAALNPHDAG
ncbi:MAG TPA: 5-(carboxyamino)imidazole ribonucleotide synthase [Pyrinomonadaceae bacterium]